jgi:Domain of unknown function (DUF4185)
LPIGRKQVPMRRFPSNASRDHFLCGLSLGLAALLFGTVAVGESAGIETANAKLVAKAWPEADALFHRDARWLGGDDAYSINLGDGRVAWFFGDSFVVPSVPGQRNGTTMVRNSVGLQTGYDPSRAEFKCYWQQADDKPSSFIPADGENFYWPGGGLLLDGKLLALFMRVRDAEGELNFETTGWGAVLIDNLQLEPSQWSIKKLSVPQNQFGVLVGSASVVRDGEHVIAFSVQGRTHDVYLVRWPLTDASNGDLTHPEWWTGRETGWIQQRELTELPTPLFTPGQTEFTVHRSEELDSYLQIQFTGFPRTSLGFRMAHALTGPWSRLEPFYRPEEARADDPGVMLYAAKAHPEQAADGLALTYASNAFQLARVIDDQSLYFPRFVTVKVEHSDE